jgi:hypothetical protein
MSDLLTQHTLRIIIGQSRLQRLVRAGWLAPVERNAHSILFNPRDVRKALSRLEHERCPPDKAEVLRVRLSEAAHGRGRVRAIKITPPVVDLTAIELDFSAVGR